MAIYGVVNTDLVSKNIVDVISAKYIPGGTETAIENGSVVKIEGLITGEANIFGAVVPERDTALNLCALVASVELMDDPRLRKLSDFTNAAGEPIRCYKFVSGSIFSVTAEALVGNSTPDVGDVVELVAGNKLSVADTLTGGSTKVGDLIAKDTRDGVIYYVIKVV